MSKYIDADKLVAKIQPHYENAKCKARYAAETGTSSDCTKWYKAKEIFEHILRIISSLQQEQLEVPAGHGWVARDMNNDLHYFSVEPARLRVKWWDRDYLSMEVDRSLFIGLSWEDEPIEVELFIREFGENARKEE